MNASTVTEAITSSIVPGAVAAASGFALGISGDILFGSFAGAMAARVLASSSTRPKDLMAWAYMALLMFVAILLSAAFAGLVADWIASFSFVTSRVIAERSAGVVVAAGAQAIVETIQIGPKALLDRFVGPKES